MRQGVLECSLLVLISRLDGNKNKRVTTIVNKLIFKSAKTGDVTARRDTLTKREVLLDLTKRNKVK